MELVLRCSLPDRPGSLAQVAAAVSDEGVDIEAVEVVEVVDGRAVDDIVMSVDGPGRAQQLLERLDALDDVHVVHTGPSRGHPGDAITRAAVGLTAILDGSSEPARGLATLLGGLLRADRAETVDRPPRTKANRLAVPVGSCWVVLHRTHAFTSTERHRADALARAAEAAAALRGGASVTP